MNAGDFLTEAKATIQDRGIEYGHPTDTMQRTARLLSAYLEVPIMDYQVAGIMVLVKLARTMETPKVDTYVDLCGYGAIMATLHTQEDELYV